VTTATLNRATLATILAARVSKADREASPAVAAIWETRVNKVVQVVAANKDSKEIRLIVVASRVNREILLIVAASKVNRVSKEKFLLTVTRKRTKALQTEI
jgi:hypothetical protein